MPRLLSDISTELADYVHPDLAFLDVFNRVLPRLAAKGIWKDLTFEKSVTVGSNDRFFTLPDDAHSVLYAMVNRDPAPVKPLWNAFANAGAAAGRMGYMYGVEDAGFVPVQEILDSDYDYCLFAFPHYSTWGTDDAPDDPRSDTAFAGTETIKVVYENWEGIEVTSTTTLSATTAPQILKVRGARNIVSIEYTGFDTVKAQVVALPVAHYGLATVSVLPNFTAVPLDDKASAFATLVPSVVDIQVYSLTGDDATVDDNALLGTLGTAYGLSASSYTGSTFPNHPVLFWPASADLSSDIRTKTGYAANAKKICVCDGTGIARYRLFRIHDPGNSIHLLLRRKIPKYTATTQIAYIDNLSALQYAFLAHNAEYRNDPDNAREWWTEAKAALDEELSASTGAATPQVRFDPSGIGEQGIAALQ